MHFLRNNGWRLAVLAGLGLAAACNNDQGSPTEPVTTPGATPQDLRVELAVSNASVAVGGRVAVSLLAGKLNGKTLGALQGTIKYDPAFLKYVGQPEDRATATLVNPSTPGLLRVGALNQAGLPETASVLVFEVLRAGYASSVGFEFQTAATAGFILSSTSRANVVKTVRADGVAAPASVRQLTLRDWQGLLVANFSPSSPISANPGDLGKVNLKYGDVNLSGGVDLSDALDVANTAVGNIQPIQGTDGTIGSTTRKDLVVAANVDPTNGGPNGACRPGLVNCANPNSGVIDLSDALEVANESVAPGTRQVAGKQIIGRGALPAQVIESCPITGNPTWDSTKVHVIPKPGSAQAPGAVCNVVGSKLTIGPGTLVLSDSNTLVVDRNSQIFINGTFLKPVEFNCLNPTASATNGGPNAAGCFGGIYVNGLAPVNNGAACPAVTIPADQVGRGSGSGGNCPQGEGNTGFYGGNSPTDNSGSITYLRIINAGTRFTATNERNSLTLQGVGSGTKIDYVNTDNGLDDGVEFFGGTVNVSHLFVDRTQDDGFDWVGGYRGKAQFVIVRGCQTACDRGIEADNFGIDGNGTDPEAAPRSAPTLYNFTLVGAPDPSTSSVTAGVILRQNTGGTLRNFLVGGWKAGLDIDQPSTAAGFVQSQAICKVIANDSLTFRNAVFFANTAAGDGDTGDPTIPTPAPNPCSQYQVNAAGSDLEAQWIAYAGSTIDFDVAPWAGNYGITGTKTFAGNAMQAPSGAATAFLVAPFATIPNFSPIGVAASTTGATPPNDGFFDNTATYLGATNPSGGLPWWTGWTTPTGR